MPFLRAALIGEKGRPEIESGPVLQPEIEQEKDVEPEQPQEQPVVVEEPESAPEIVVEQETEQPEEEQQQENEELSVPEQQPEVDTEQQTVVEQETELPPETEEQQQETELPPDTEEQPEPEPEPDTTTTSEHDYSGATLQYDFTSGERYVDKVSTKTEFDKMLDELASISHELLTHEVEKFALKFTAKFHGESDKAEADAKKFEAFLGGYIANAAKILYDHGYRDAALKKLDQARSIIEAKKRLEEEAEATRNRVEENNDSVDLSDILGLIGD